MTRMPRNKIVAIAIAALYIRRNEVQIVNNRASRFDLAYVACPESKGNCILIGARIRHEERRHHRDICAD